MDRRTTKILRAVVAALVFATAAFHLWWGLPRSIIYAMALDGLLGQGLPPDPRPFLFVAFATVLLAGPYLVTRGVVGLRNAYIAGTLLMVASIAGWVFWHATGHGAFLVEGFSAPASDSGGHHGGSVVLLILDHFVTEPVESGLKTLEAIATALFVTLLWKDPAIMPAERHNGAESGASSES